MFLSKLSRIEVSLRYTISLITRLDSALNKEYLSSVSDWVAGGLGRPKSFLFLEASNVSPNLSIL
jgi:hypothetical protein